MPVLKHSTNLRVARKCFSLFGMPLLVGSLSTPFYPFVELMYIYSENQAKWNASQVAHGNISIDTICIGDIKSPGARGFLINPEDSTVCLLVHANDRRPMKLFLPETKRQSYVPICRRYIPQFNEKLASQLS